MASPMWPGPAGSAGRALLACQLLRAELPVEGGSEGGTPVAGAAGSHPRGTPAGVPTTIRTAGMEVRSAPGWFGGGTTSGTARPQPRICSAFAPLYDRPRRSVKTFLGERVAIMNAWTLVARSDTIAMPRDSDNQSYDPVRIRTRQEPIPLSRTIVVLNGARTPMAEFNGKLRNVTEIDLGAAAARAAMARSE